MDYTVDIYFKFDPKEERTETFGLEVENLDEAIEFVKNREDYETIEYFIISDETGDIYNSDNINT